MSKPEISVTIPSLNQARWLPEALDSARAAAARAGITIEIFVADGGSTDGTREFLETQRDVDWISEPDDGQTDAINKGLRRAQGKILAYLCADDLYEPDAFVRVTDAFAQDARADFVYGDGCFLEGASGWKRRKVAGPFSWQRLRRRNFLIQPAVFFRAEVFRRLGEFDVGLQFCMDHEYWLRAGPSARWVYLPVPLATSRLHSGAKTSRALADAWEEAARMQARYGMRIRPWIEAFWMRLAGGALYALRRRVYAAMGERISGSKTS